MTKEEFDNLDKEARDLMNKKDFGFRSCSDCNSAHAHFRGLHLCFACGHWWYKGHDMTKLSEEYDKDE